MDTNYNSLNLTEIKDVYWVYNRGGPKSIRANGLTSSLCSLFLIVYMYILLFRVNWQAVIESPAQDRWFTPRSRDPCKNIFLCSVALYSNLLVTFTIMLWSVIASVFRCRKAVHIKEVVNARIGECPLDGSSKWDTIAANVTMNISNPENIAFFLCAETRQTALVFKLLNIDPSSIWVSRYLVWAIQSTLSISRRGVILDASALNLEIDGPGDTLDLAVSSSRIRRVAALLILTSPFFILYYLTRVLIQEFHDHKARNGAEKYTWSVGAQYSLRKKNELPHLFNRRLRRIQESVEIVKKSRKYSSLVECCLNIFQFIITCGLITCALVSFISMEEGVWNEPMGVMTGALSACLMLGLSNNKKTEASGIKKLEKKIKSKMGKNCAEVERYLNSRWVHVAMELLGIVIAPFFLIMKLLPKLDQISIAIEMDNPCATEYPNIYFEEPAERKTRDGYYSDAFPTFTPPVSNPPDDDRLEWEYSDDEEECNRRKAML